MQKRKLAEKIVEYLNVGQSAIIFKFKRIVSKKEYLIFYVGLNLANGKQFIKDFRRRTSFWSRQTF